MYKLITWGSKRRRRTLPGLGVKVWWQWWFNREGLLLKLLMQSLNQENNNLGSFTGLETLRVDKVLVWCCQSHWWSTVELLARGEQGWKFAVKLWWWGWITMVVWGMVSSLTYLQGKGLFGFIFLLLVQGRGSFFFSPLFSLSFASVFILFYHLNFTLIYTRWRRCLDPFQTWIMTIDSPRNWSQALAYANNLVLSKAGCWG